MWAVLRLEKEHLDIYASGKRPEEEEEEEEEKTRGGGVEVEGGGKGVEEGQGGGGGGGGEMEEEAPSEIVRLLDIHPAMLDHDDAISKRRKKKPPSLLQLDGRSLSRDEVSRWFLPQRRQIFYEGVAITAAQLLVVILAMNQ